MVAVSVVLSSGCVAAPGTPQETASEFLAKNPVLPRAYVRTEDGRPIEVVPLDWRLVGGDRQQEPSAVCPKEGQEVSRGWSDGGKPLVTPAVFQVVCLYPDSPSARTRYDSLALADALGSNDFGIFPNTFGPPAISGHEEEIFPPGTPSLVNAQAFEIACVTGDAREVCLDWFFRGLYGAAIARIYFYGGGGGIQYEEFLAIVRSIDREMAP